MMDLHKLASLMVRDLTIGAKQLTELARTHRALAATWRQVLDGTRPPVLQTTLHREDGKAAAPELPLDPFGSWENSDV